VDQPAIRTVVSLLVVLAAVPAAAQPPQDLPQGLARVEPGETVALLDTDGQRLAGRIASVSANGLTLVQAGRTMSVPLQRVARVTVADSNRNGMLIGALIGAGIGIAGGAAVNAICANEGGDCIAIVLGLAAAGAAGGAGIGWLGDRVHQPVLYALPGSRREFASELRLKLSTDARAGTMFPAIGGSWGMTSSSGFGFEVNADRSMGGKGGEGRGNSLDGRVLYFFGNARLRPYVVGGAGYFEYYKAYSVLVPASRFMPEHLLEGQSNIHSVAPLVGGGVRVQAARSLSIRPEVVWYRRPGGSLSGLRAGVSAGVTW